MVGRSLKEVSLDGVAYVRKDVAPDPIKGRRAVVVIDRGWIFAGDVVEAEDGRLKLDRAVWVFSWQNVGLDGVIANPKSDKVILKPMPNGVNIPRDSEIFRIPVPNDWGL